MEKNTGEIVAEVKGNPDLVRELRILDKMQGIISKRINAAFDEIKFEYASEVQQIWDNIGKFLPDYDPAKRYVYDRDENLIWVPTEEE